MYDWAFTLEVTPLLVGAVIQPLPSSQSPDTPHNIFSVCIALNVTRINLYQTLSLDSSTEVFSHYEKGQVGFHDWYLPWVDLVDCLADYFHPMPDNCRVVGRLCEYE